MFQWSTGQIKFGKQLNECLAHITDGGENVDENVIKRLYTNLDILLCEAIVDSGIAEDPAKILTPLKHNFAEMQKEVNNSAAEGQVNEKIEYVTVDNILPCSENENKSAAQQIWEEIEGNTSQIPITKFLEPIPKNRDEFSDDLILVEGDYIVSTQTENSSEKSDPSNKQISIQDTDSDDRLKFLASEIINLRVQIKEKNEHFTKKLRSLETKLQKEYFTTGQINDIFGLRDVPPEWNECSITFDMAKSHSLSADIFALMGFLDPEFNTKLRSDWWAENINKKRLSFEKAVYLAKHCNHIIVNLNQMWIENISAFSLENIYMKILGLIKILNELKFAKWPKTIELEKTLNHIPKCDNVKKLKAVLTGVSFFNLDFSVLIHDKNHWSNFETNELEAIDSWSKIKFRVNLKDFEEPYINIFPEQGDNHLEEIDSRMSQVSVTKNADEQQKSSSSSSSSNELSSDEDSPKCKKRKSNYVEPSYSKFWDEFNKLSK